MNDNIYKIYEQIADGHRGGEFTHSEVCEMFVEFLSDTLQLRVELGLTRLDVKVLNDALAAIRQVELIDPEQRMDNAYENDTL